MQPPAARVLPSSGVMTSRCQGLCASSWLSGFAQLVFNNQFQPEKHIAETISLLEELKGAEPKFSFPKLF